MSTDLNPELLAVLADPETREPVSLANEAQLARLREALASGEARRHDGAAPPTEVQAALISQQGKVAYLVQDGIPNLLVDERLELSVSLSDIS